MRLKTGGFRLIEDQLPLGNYVLLRPSRPRVPVDLGLGQLEPIVGIATVIGIIAGGLFIYASIKELNTGKRLR